MIWGKVGREAGKALKGRPKTGTKREGFGAVQSRVQVPALTFISLEPSPHWASAASSLQGGKPTEPRPGGCCESNIRCPELLVHSKVC